MDFKGFMSYVRQDDQHESGRITKFRTNLSSEVGFQVGEPVPIFQDIEDILVGERWRRTIYNSIDGCTFLLAIITPSFFRSAACRDEIKKFLQREAALDRDDLIFPVLYQNTPALKDPTDEIAVEIGRRQYDDWRSLRFDDLDSHPCRSRIAQLAEQIVTSLQRTAEHPVTLSTSNVKISDDLDSDAPGFVELVAAAEDAMPMFVATMESFSDALTVVSGITNTATADLTAAAARGKGAAAKLSIARRLASDLTEPVEGMEQYADEYVDQLNRVDGGLQALIARIGETEDGEEIAVAHKFLDSVTTLDTNAEEGLTAIGGFVNTLQANSGMSSTLRPVLKRMAVAAQKLVDSRPVFAEWRDGLETVLEAKGKNE